MAAFWTLAYQLALSILAKQSLVWDKREQKRWATNLTLAINLDTVAEKSLENRYQETKTILGLEMKHCRSRHTPMSDDSYNAIANYLALTCQLVRWLSLALEKGWENS